MYSFSVKPDDFRPVLAFRLQAPIDQWWFLDDVFIVHLSCFRKLCRYLHLYYIWVTESLSRPPKLYSTGPDVAPSYKYYRRLWILATASVPLLWRGALSCWAAWRAKCPMSKDKNKTPQGDDIFASSGSSSGPGSDFQSLPSSGNWVSTEFNITSQPLRDLQ